MKQYYHTIGKLREGRFHCLNVGTWDGKAKVFVIFPLKPTKKEKEETADFILGECDDHDAYTKFVKLVRKG
jgi:hypothetical protein